MLKKLLPIEIFNGFRVSALRLVVLSALLGNIGCSRISSEEIKKAEKNNPDTATAVLNQPVKPAVTMVLTDMPFEQVVSATGDLLDDFWRQSFKDMNLRGINSV